MTASTSPRRPERRSVGGLLTLMSNGRDRRDLRPVVWEVTHEAEAFLLASVLFDVRRDRPVLVVTSRGQGRHPLHVDQAASELHGLVDVVAARDSQTAQALCAALPSWLAVDGGSSRVYLPGADLGDDDDRHPLVHPMRRKDDMTARAVRVARAAAARKRDGDPTVALARERREHDETRQALVRARADLVDARAAGAGADDPAEQVVFADPEVQFEHELYLYWLRGTPECDRDRWPLRDYRLGPEFLDSLEEVRDVGRPRLVRACVDVVTGRYAEIRGRGAKRLHDGTPTSGRGCPDLVRASDGAHAWRCNVQIKGIGARLMWWELKEGEPELARINCHENFRIV